MESRTRPARPARLPRPVPGLAVLAVVGALTFLTYRSLVGLSLLGWDGWPMVLTSRIEGPGDLLSIFSRELMDGRYPHGHFYRPITQLTFALDHALTGLDPAGYHRTDLVILALAATLLAALGRRLFGTGGLAIGLVGALTFVVHPVQLELLPVAPRRADTLALAFTLACLLVQPRAGERSGHLGALFAGLWAACAVGAKETGAVVAPLVIGLHLLHPTPVGGALGPPRPPRPPGSPDPSGPGARVRGSLGRAAPALAGVALVLAMRTVVLGGLGGHLASAGERPVPTPELWGQLLLRVILPQPWIADPTRAWTVVGAATGGLLLLGGTLARSAGPGAVPPGRRGDRGDRPALAFLALWALCLFAITGLADRLHDWYAMLFVAPYSLLLGLLLVRGATLVRGGRGAARAAWPGAPALALALGLTASHLACSPLVRPYPLLQAASTLAERTYRGLERMIEGAGEGQVVRYIPWIPYLAPNPDGSDVRSLHLADAYTIQAWCELRWPDTTFEVTRWAGQGLPGKPGVLRVQLVPGNEPSWVRDAEARRVEQRREH